MAGLFIGSLIVDALVPIIGIAWKNHNDEKHKPDKTPPTDHPSGGGANDGGDTDMDDYAFDTPCLTPDVIMDVVNKRLFETPVETPKPKRLDRQEKRDRDVDFTGPSYSAGWCRDFSAIQRTRVNPVTGRIIGYKGIPRKRALSPTSKYSSFWRDQKYAKPSLHAARNPGIWDSARR